MTTRQNNQLDDCGCYALEVKNFILVQMLTITPYTSRSIFHNSVPHNPYFNPFLHIYSFEHIEENIVGKKVKLLKMRNFTFFHSVFYTICILKSFNSHISAIGLQHMVCSFFEFGTFSKWCIREWVKLP